MLKILNQLKYQDPPLWLLAVLFVVPVILQLNDAAPPWPGAVGWTTAVGNVALALGFGRIVDRHPTWSNRFTVFIALVFAIACLISYLVLTSRYVFTIPTTGELGIMGFQCTPEALLVYPDNCPGNVKEALASAEFESALIWQQETIDLVRLGILGTWLVSFMALCWMAASLAARPFSTLIKQTPPSYEGKDDYFFMSYSHTDLGRIIPFLAQFHDRGHKIWFDKGIPGTSPWDETLSVRIRGSSGIIAFLSPAALESKWVRREILFADDLNKSLFCVRLTNCELHPPLDMVLARNQIIDGDPKHILSEFERAYGQHGGA